jgi:hypothetical protein
MMKESRLMSLVEKIMTHFAHLTGLSPVSSMSRRYLWTDAFAVCNFLGLYQETGGELKNLAVQHHDQVNNGLGRHWQDDDYAGWISGQNEEEGRLHLSKGGLRVGNQLKERRPSDPFNEHLEWDRDGQHNHYLIKR